MTKGKGFIAHPFETGNGRYHASYGNHNKTVKSFRTLAEAQRYLRNKGISEANYDAPSGFKSINLNSSKRKVFPKQNRSARRNSDDIFSGGMFG